MSSKTESNPKSGSDRVKKRKIDLSVDENEPNQNQKIAKKEASGSRLPEDVLKRIEVEQGKVVIAGNVAWETVGKKSNARNELCVFHRLDNKMVTKSLYFFKFYLVNN